MTNTKIKSYISYIFVARNIFFEGYLKVEWNYENFFGMTFIDLDCNTIYTNKSESLPMMRIPN